jgi:flagellar basal body-associated protein FliL
MRIILLFIISILLLTSFVVYYRFSPKGFTGFVPMVNVTVKVEETTKGEITALIYKEYINFTDIQDITTEFANVGGSTLTEKIEIRIYWNNQSKLQEMAYYYDSQAVLQPSMRRTYSISFLPPYLGLYYIKVKVPYDSKAVERWGSFMVIYPPSSPSQVIIPPAPIPAPRAPIPTVTEEAGVPDIDLKYPETVNITQGESKLFSILAKNIGNVSLNNLRLYISTTNLITIEINPKSVFKLSPNESAIFLISVNVPKTIPLGKYPFDFVMISDEIRKAKSIELQIVSAFPSIGEEVYGTILNYEYIISEIQNEIDSAVLKGIDVKIPQDTLNRAKLGLELAKDYYKQGKSEDAKSKLAEVKKYLEDAVYQLAVAGIKVQLPAFTPIIIIVIILFVGIILALFLFLLKRIKEKEKRPKLLGALSETET